MIRLYAGLQRDNQWFNYCKVEPLKGGAIALIDGLDKSGASRLLNLIKASVPALYTEAGEKRELIENDYTSMFYADAWKIALEYIKDFSSSGTFAENHYCNVCSSPGNEHYTEVNENWAELIETGYVDEYYLNEPVFTWPVELSEGFEIPANNAFKGGVFSSVVMGHLTMGDMLKISNLPDVKQNEASMICAIIDSQLKSVDGMEQRDFNMYVKRSLRDSFTRKYIKNIDDQTKLLDSKPLGLNASNRPVTCKHCHSEIGGGLDFTNFFSALLRPKSDRKSLKNVVSIQGLV